MTKNGSIQEEGVIVMNISETSTGTLNMQRKY
jgi:hypothetical protein